MQSCFISLLNEADADIEAGLLSIFCHIGSVISTRLSKIDYRFGKRSCLKRIILEESGILVKPQNLPTYLEY